jgi:hypothetical protein
LATTTISVMYAMTTIVPEQRGHTKASTEYPAQQVTPPQPLALPGQDERLSLGRR